ncbi:MAG: DUF2630 family protein [Microthrixaceae bacterium]
MADDETLGAINKLADEETALRKKEADGQASEEDRARISEVEDLLDQCWDLLRQRRARRDAGLDPEGAHARSIDTVEHYKQ